MSLPRSQKIKQHQSYALAMKSGNVERLDGFKVYTAPNQKLQVGVVIPKRMIVLASDRQQLRRRIHGLTQDIVLGDVMLVVQVTKKWKDPIDLSSLKSTLLKFSEGSIVPKDSPSP